MRDRVLRISSGAIFQAWYHFPAISRRQRAIHFSLRAMVTCSNVRPSPSSVAFFPARSCQRWTMTSTYFGSNSILQQTRSVSSAAAGVVPLPRNGSYTSSPRFVWFRIGPRINSAGLGVG
jgi:hypothetical protein